MPSRHSRTNKILQLVYYQLNAVKKSSHADTDLICPALLLLLEQLFCSIAEEAQNDLGAQISNLSDSLSACIDSLASDHWFGIQIRELLSNPESWLSEFLVERKSLLLDLGDTKAKSASIIASSDVKSLLEREREWLWAMEALIEVVREYNQEF